MTNREKIIIAFIAILFLVMNYMRTDSLAHMLKKEKELSYKAIQAFKNKEDISEYLNQINYLNQKIKQKFNSKDIQTMTAFINMRLQEIKHSKNIDLNTMYKLYSEISEEERYILSNLSI